MSCGSPNCGKDKICYITLAVHINGYITVAVLGVPNVETPKKKNCQHNQFSLLKVDVDNLATQRLLYWVPKVATE